MKKLWLLFLLPISLIGADFEECVKRELPKSFCEKWFALLVFGEALYWHLKMGGAEYAYTFLGNACGFNTPQSIDAEEAEFNWGWGARTGVGLTFPKLGWELICRGTWYATDQKGRYNHNLPSILINLGEDFLSKSHHAQSSYDLSYDELLLTFQKWRSFGSFLSFYTSIGAKRSSVNQEQDFYARLHQWQTCRIKDRCHFVGGGPRFGFGTKWHLFCGAHLIVDIGAALLYGEFDVKHREKLHSLSEIDLRANPHLLSPEVDFAFGLGWDLSTARYHLGISLNYEALYAWRQHEAMQMDEIAPSATGSTGGRFQVVRYAEDLIFYGAVLKAKLKF